MIHPRLVFASIVAAFSLALGLFALYAHPRKRLNRTFALGSLALAIWHASGYAFLLSSHEVAINLYRVMYLSSLVVFLSTVSFFQELFGAYETSVGARWRWVSRVICVLMAPLFLTPLVIKDFAFVPGETTPYKMMAGPLYAIGFALNGIVLGIIGYLFGRARGRYYLKPVLAAVGLGMVAVLMRVFLVVDQMMWMYFAVLMGVHGFFAYLMARHNLLELGPLGKIGVAGAGFYFLLLGVPFLPIRLDIHPGLVLALGSVAYSYLFMVLERRNARLRVFRESDEYRAIVAETERVIADSKRKLQEGDGSQRESLKKR